MLKDGRLSQMREQMEAGWFFLLLPSKPQVGREQVPKYLPSKMIVIWSEEGNWVSWCIRFW